MKLFPKEHFQEEMEDAITQLQIMREQKL